VPIVSSIRLNAVRVGASAPYLVVRNDIAEDFAVALARAAKLRTMFAAQLRAYGVGRSEPSPRPPDRAPRIPLRRGDVDEIGALRLRLFRRFDRVRSRCARSRRAACIQAILKKSTSTWVAEGRRKYLVVTRPDNAPTSTTFAVSFAWMGSRDRRSSYIPNDV
jgi:hypothetical protein